ncbi:hypothetical protein PVK06_009658 [Gossypium arboreum]|uniref:Uncharacterized protein n=1 Tax=Gossypium arboreum TaxID=29729 RepID=A0ABR0QNG3_GOSAR|nr:hypothetical protein PVK06_009658 [Gossypium arboreum]
METKNNSSSSSVTVSETFKFNGKWATLALLLAAFITSAIVYKCLRGRINAETNVQADVELPATAPE